MYSFLECMGLILIIIIVCHIVKSLTILIYKVILNICDKNINLKHTGQWALITGATDGIGKAFAEKFASKGMNIVLISKSLVKLQTVASEIEKEYKVETKVIQVDFTKSDEIYDQIEKNIQGYEISVLVNNVGLSYPYPEYFLDLAKSDVIFSSIIRCNIKSLVNMCRIVMPGMHERKEGYVINISSTAAIIPAPMLTVYSASKAFVRKFSEDLATEYSKDGITVQCLIPGYVATKLSKIRKSTWMAPSPQRYVENAFKTIGIKQRTTGYYPHYLLLNVIYSIQYFSKKLARRIVLRVMENIRNRAVRKQLT